MSSDLSVLCTVNREAWQQPDEAIWDQQAQVKHIMLEQLC